MRTLPTRTSLAPRARLAPLLALAAAGACSDGAPDPCDEPGVACVWAGTGERGFDADGRDRRDAKLYFPEDVTFAPDGRAYIVDYNNHRVRRVEPSGALATVIGTSFEGDGPPEMEDRLPRCAPAGAPGTTVALNHPTDLEPGPDGRLYLAAWHNHKIRAWDPATGIVTALGDGYGFRGDGGPACDALFDQPKALAFAADGTLYAIDQRNARIRAIAPPPDSTIRTIAGTGEVGNGGDGGPAIEAQLGFETEASPRPSGGLALDGRTLYVADSLNHRVRRIDLDTGIIDCIAGQSAVAGYAGDGGPALDARFDDPVDLELSADRDTLYVADRGNHAVRAIDLASGTVTTVVGTGAACETELSACPDRALATEVQLFAPYGIGLDAAGALYVADTQNNRVLRVAP